MRNSYILDTNILLRGKDEKGIISYPVICELDRLKTFSAEVGKDARDAIYKIYSDTGNFTLESEDKLENETVDDFLIRQAKSRGLTLKTLDLSLFLKAKANGVEAIFDEYAYSNEYTGVTYLDDVSDGATLEKIFRGEPLDPKEFPNNHFIISDRLTYRVMENRAEIIKNQSISSIYVQRITPKNLEQRCAFELLSDKRVTVLSFSGTYGTGKSLLMMSYALQELEKGSIAKIVIVPNNSAVASTKELAALPGGIFEKELSYTATLIDLLGIDRLRKMVETEQIEILPMAVARGRNLINSIVIATESQNLTSQHAQLLLGRIGADSRIFFDGDWAQTDQKLFRNNSGLRQLNKLAFTEHSKLFGTVQLRSIERSETARLAEVLGKL